MAGDGSIAPNEEAIVPQAGLRGHINSLRSKFRGKTTEEQLAICEAKLLSGLKTSYNAFPVQLDEQDPKRVIWTLCLGENGENKGVDKSGKPPLVLIHGFGAGSALWMHNFDALASNRPVYAIDLLGFARSGRSPLNPEMTADDWSETIEQWRLKMGIEKMNILAHSFGGYLSSLYALKHPDRLGHLFLIEPWGFGEPPKDERGVVVVHRPLFIRIVIRCLFFFHPLSVLRVAGPLGPRIIEKVRPDLGRKYAPSADIAPYIYKYIHYCNAKSPPTGEAGFKRLVDNYGYPLEPMIHRIGQLPLSVKLSLVFGSDSWMDAKIGNETQQARASFHNVDFDSTNTTFHLMEKAGHHLYVEQSESFNELVNEILHETV